LITQANKNESVKVVALTISLKRKTRVVLDGIIDLEDLRYFEFKLRLKSRFREGHMAQTQFTNRKQKFNEDFSTLGADLEHLSRLTYPRCFFEMRNKIAYAQFIGVVEWFY